MNKSELMSVLNKIPYNHNLSTRSIQQIESELDKTAKYLAKNLNCQSQIVAGGTSPNTKDRYFRIYIDWRGANHTTKKGVIDYFEHHVQSKWGYHPLSKHQLFRLCDNLIEAANSIKGKRNPLKKGK